MDLLCWVALAVRALASVGASLQLPAAEVRERPLARHHCCSAFPAVRIHLDMDWSWHIGASAAGYLPCGATTQRVCPGSESHALKH